MLDIEINGYFTFKENYLELVVLNTVGLINE